MASLRAFCAQVEREHALTLNLRHVAAIVASVQGDRIGKLVAEWVEGMSHRETGLLLKALASELVAQADGAGTAALKRVPPTDSH